MAASSPPPPPVDVEVDAAPAAEEQVPPPPVSELKAGSGRKREREGSMEPSDKMSALKLAALGLKKVKEDAEPSVSAGASKDRLSKSPPPVPAAPLSPPSAVPSTTEASSSAASSSKATSADAAPPPKPKQPTFSSFTSSGFGSVASSGSSNAFSAFANAKPFGSAAGATTSVSAGASSFGDILSKGGRASKTDEAAAKGDAEFNTTADVESEAADADDDGEGEGVVKLAAQDTITGEEDEDTRHQVRCKLYVLEKEGSWKERGTGIFKLNVNHSSAKPRLLMRADGVLRLILNVALFPGMSCERQDKWVRFSAFEDAQLSHLAVRTGSVKSAEELFDKIQTLMPSDGSRPTPVAKASTSPAATASAAKPKPPPLVHSTSTEVTFKEDESETKPETPALPDDQSAA